LEGSQTCQTGSCEVECSLPGQPHKGRRGPGSWSRIYHTQIPYLGRCGILFAASIHPQPRRGMWSSQRLRSQHDFSLQSSLLRYRSEWTPRSSSPSSNAMLNLSTPWVDSVPLGFDSPASSPGDSTEIANGEENRGGNWGPSGHLPTTTSSPASSRLAGFLRRRAREAARRAPLLPPQLIPQEISSLRRARAKEGALGIH
jgi:hypothetical protein